MDEKRRITMQEGYAFFEKFVDLRTNDGIWAYNILATIVECCLASLDPRVRSEAFDFIVHRMKMVGNECFEDEHDYLDYLKERLGR